MFSLKELYKIRSIIDKYCYATDEEAMEIRDKVSDMIQIKKAWNVNKHIECRVID